MDFPILGLHHVTATVDDAQADLDFYLGCWACGSSRRPSTSTTTASTTSTTVTSGAPGTIWTTFPYRGRGVPTGIKGAGQITTTSFSVPAGSLDFWRARLTARDYAVIDEPPRFGEESILVAIRRD